MPHQALEMSSHRLICRLVAALLLPLLLMSGTAQAHAVFRCRFDGVLRAKCCCPGESPAPPERAVTKACCCDNEFIQVTLSPADNARHEASDDNPLPLSWLTTLLVTDALSPHARPRLFGVAHPSHGPPLFLVKQSFLL